MLLRPWMAVSFAAAAALAQEAAPEAPKAAEYTIAPGTKIPLTLINTISTKGTQEGDTVYLKTAFPVVANGRIVIPVPSYVSGTVTHVVKPGRDLAERSAEGLSRPFQQPVRVQRRRGAWDSPGMS